jgi:hypothetical protein
MIKAENEDIWLRIIARALAYLCLQSPENEGKTLLQKASILEGLGMARGDIAAVLGTTPASLSELNRQARKRLQAPVRSRAKRRVSSR